MRRAALGRRDALGAVLAGLVYGRIDTRKSNDGTAVWKTAYIADLSHELGGSRFTPTPYMARTVSYSGSCFARRGISARKAASVILPASSCCAAVVMSNFVLSFFGSVVKWPQLPA